MGNLIRIAMEGLGINWKILVGQIINFAILFFLLKRFAYKPFLAMLEKRRLKIEEGLKKTEEAEGALQKIKSLGAEIQERKEKEGYDLIKKAESRARDLAKEIVDSAESEKNRIIEETQKAMVKEFARERADREKRMIESVFLLAEKFLKEKHSLENDKKFIEELISGLKK